jgi:hypothetical protein
MNGMAMDSLPWQPHVFASVEQEGMKYTRKRVWVSFKLFRLCCPILTEIEFCRQILVKLSNINCHDNPCSESRVVSLGQIEGPMDG